jgi:hypothetical protein
VIVEGVEQEEEYKSASVRKQQCGSWLVMRCKAAI